MSERLEKLSEPLLEFGYAQAVEDPRDGLCLFGPLDEGKPYGIRAGVIGTRDAIKRFSNWVRNIQGPVASEDPSTHIYRPPFPGFEAAYGIPWSPEPAVAVEVDEKKLLICLYQEDRHYRVFQTVDFFAEKILDYTIREESTADVWFVIIPEGVYRYCRPQSNVEAELRTFSNASLSGVLIEQLRSGPSLFEDINVAGKPYQYEPHFHNQLKAKLLPRLIPTQVVRESTIAPSDFLNPFGYPARRVDDPSTISWNLSNATFYKAGGRPWKISNIREGVCYVGIVFKQDLRTTDRRNACCAAQMFLDSGDGVVFKGAVGPWYSPDRREYHLDAESAKQLIELAIDTYKKSSKTGSSPRELFLHGKVRFNDQEWAGFQAGAGNETQVVGVRIRRERFLKVYGKQNYPVLRGMAYVQDSRTAYLWTVGFTPRLQTYLGKEVPNPLFIDVCRGEADIATVLKDVLALTKLNYNACIFGDGLPVTLRFADAVGEILTAGPVPSNVPLPFKYYI